MVGWHHRLGGHEFEQAPAVGDGQGGLACCGHGVAKSRTGLSDGTTPRDLQLQDQSRFALSPLRSCS